MTAITIAHDGDPGDEPLKSEQNPRQRILVVEDDPDIRRVHTEVLTYSGYHVDAAEDGAAAWDALQLKKYDLVVTDNDMPKLTGVELIQKLQAARMDVPVIMATGASPDEELSRCGLSAPAVILLKPHSFDELLAAVIEVLRSASSSLGKFAPPPNWQGPPLSDRLRQ